MRSVLFVLRSRRAYVVKWERAMAGWMLPDRRSGIETPTASSLAGSMCDWSAHLTSPKGDLKNSTGRHIHIRNELTHPTLVKTGFSSVKPARVA